MMKAMVGTVLGLIAARTLRRAMVACALLSSDSLNQWRAAAEADSATWPCAGVMIAS